MSEHILLDPRSQQIFSPLLEWRILALKELAEFTKELGFSYRSVARIANIFIKAGLLKEKYLGGPRNKFLYPGSNGQEFLFGDARLMNLDESQITHDYLVGKIMREMKVLSKVYSVVLEHKIRGTRFSGLGEITPDALMEVEIKNNREWWAIELELTRKSKDRLHKKIEGHAIHGKWDRALYITHNESIASLVLEILQKITIPDIKDKVLIAYSNEEVMGPTFSKNLWLIHAKGKMKLADLLN